ncbi:uncharacterized protein LOC127838161 isoform X1 [Dreissena polymorpha]|uniref:Cysteine and tyrosine-rich protein 1 n=1 Tax=Dreissena polymorpha TaxID=45954 RepID=A0A9D4FB54_DREPO|nr:uncharacterized protein LOC127838161 isoform X1 [Dreissena polymorpha]KAH3793380.1 hypothetical protein DPMN_146888 [Dreissena polymorpha]
MHSSLLIVFLCCCFVRLTLTSDYCGDGYYCYSGTYCCTYTYSPNSYYCCGIGSAGIAGVVVSSIVLIIVIVVIVLCCRRYRQPTFVRTGVVSPGVTVIASGQQMGSFPQSAPYGQYPGQPTQYPGQPAPYPGQPGFYPQPQPQYTP